MERVHTAFRDAAAALRVPERDAADAPAAVPRHARVWAPDAISLPNTEDAATISPSSTPLAELPLFTLAPRWFEYYAYIGVGTPPQYLRVVLDTAGSDLSLLGVDRTRHDMYDHARSTSYVANNTLVRTALPGLPKSDVALGVLSQDRVTLSADLRASNQTFTELLDRRDSDASRFFEDTLADGWLGLGRARLQQAFPVPSLVHRLLENATSRVVGIHLNPLTTGLVSFGGVNPQRFHGNLSFVDVIPLKGELTPRALADAYWSFRVDGVLVNGEPVAAKEGGVLAIGGDSAVLDAVLPLIRGPPDVVNAINRALGQDDALRVPCTGAASVNVTLLLGGHAFVLTREDLVAAAQRGSGCESLLAPALPMAPADWIIGAPFMQAFYTALDFGAADGGARRARPRVGFARSQRAAPPAFSAYDSLWLVLLALVVVLILRSIGRQRIPHRRPSAPKSSAA